MRFEWPGIAISWPLPVPLLFIFLISMIQLLLCTLKLVSHVQSQCLGTGFKGLQADRESFFPYVFLFSKFKQHLIHFSTG